MKEKTNNNFLIYIIFTIIFFSLIAYILYTTFYTSMNIKDNFILEENNKENMINIYEDESIIHLIEIASYSTIIYDNDKNRMHNISLACSSLNGYIVKAGEEFSFNSKLGEMDKEDGYKKATGFDSNGKKIKMYGGGICQISSTLYNAVLIANLEVTERHAHSRRVNYVPKNKDATVYYGGPDFKFINNTSNDIIIYANTDGFTVNISLISQDKSK